MEENGSASSTFGLEWPGQLNFCFREADEKLPGRSCEHFAVAAPTPAMLWAPAGVTSLFPAKREVKREVSKAWQAWPGNQTSCKGLVGSLVGAGGAWSGPGPQIRIPLETKRYPTRNVSGPILPFLDVFAARQLIKKEALPRAGGPCSRKPRGA